MLPKAECSLFIVLIVPCSRISTPRTKYTKDPISTVPLYGLSRMKEVIAQALPELKEFEFTDSRVRFNHEIYTGYANMP